MSCVGGDAKDGNSQLCKACFPGRGNDEALEAGTREDLQLKGECAECGTTGDGYDTTYKCNSCSRWVHMTCAGEVDEETNEPRCTICTTRRKERRSVLEDTDDSEGEGRKSESSLTTEEGEGDSEYSDTLSKAPVTRSSGKGRRDPKQSKNTSNKITPVKTPIRHAGTKDIREALSIGKGDNVGSAESRRMHKARTNSASPVRCRPERRKLRSNNSR